MINNVLPSELLQTVFSFVITPERARTLPLVCPLWNDLLKGPSLAWGHQAITVTDADVSRSLLVHLERRGAATTSIDLVYCGDASDDTGDGLLVDSSLLATVRDMPHLRACALRDLALGAERVGKLLSSRSLQDLEVDMLFWTTAADLQELGRWCGAPLKRLRLGLNVNQYVKSSGDVLGAVSAFSSVPCLLLKCHDFEWSEGSEDDYDWGVSCLVLPRSLTDLPCLQALDVDQWVRLQGPLPELMTRLELKCGPWGDVYPGLQGLTCLRVLRLEFPGDKSGLLEGLSSLVFLQELAITMQSVSSHEVKLCLPQLTFLSLQGCSGNGFLLGWEAEPHVAHITLRHVRTTSELPFHRLSRLTSLVLDCCEGPRGPYAWSDILPKLHVSLREVQLETAFVLETTFPRVSIAALPFEDLPSCVHLTNLQKLRLVCGAVMRPQGSVDLGPKNGYISPADIGLVQDYVHTSLPGCARVLFQFRVLKWHFFGHYHSCEVTVKKCAGAGARLFDTSGQVDLQGPNFDQVWLAVESAALFDASSMKI